MTFNAGGTIVFSYTDGTERWELRVPCAEFDPATFAYTGTGLKIPTEADIAATVANFGGVWSPYFDPSWTLTLEALFHTSGDTGTRLGTLPSVPDVTGTSSTPSSANPPLMRGFTFTLDNRKRQVVRFFSVATTTTGARREVTATSGGFDSRDQALMAYLAGPSTGLVAWDGQVFPPTASAYQRYKLAPFERGGGGGGSSPPADCITFPRGATVCNDAADVVHLRTPGATHALDLTGYKLPGDGRLEAHTGVFSVADTFARPDQSGFGTASDGHAWSRFAAGLIDPTASDPAGALAVQGNEGLLRFIVGSNQLAPVLGPSLAGADCELLVRWQATVTEISGDTLDTIQLGMLARLSDYDHGVLFLMAGWTHTGGTPDPVVQVVDAPDFPVTQSPQNVSPIVGGQRYWTRWRMVGQTYSWRTWLDGASEPTSWDGTWTDTAWPESGVSGTSVGLFLYPRGNTSLVAEVDHFSASTIGAAAGIRLLGPDGTTRWEHDGHTWRVTSDGADVLVTPLSTLAVSPATLVGRDPASGLPAFCPAPIPTTTTVVLGGGSGIQPAPPTDCVQVRCGVSAVLMAHLLSLYDDWARWLDPLFQACATLGVAVAVATVPWDWIGDLGLAEAAGAIKSGIVTLLQGFVGAITGNLLPPLDPDMQGQIKQAAFDALDCTGDQVQVSVANVVAWQAALAALTTWPISSLAGPFCGLLLQYTPLAAWQGAAAAASPSHACDAWP